MLGGADNPNGELLSYIIGADNITGSTGLTTGLHNGSPEIQWFVCHHAYPPCPSFSEGVNSV